MSLTVFLSLLIFNTVSGFESDKALGIEIPSDTLLKKDHTWEQKYTSSDEFYKIDRAIRAYVEDTHPMNPWNMETKKNAIKIYNFDAIVGEKEAGLNAFLVNVHEQKSNGVYKPTIAEQKFHEWASKKINDPVKPDVDDVLIEQVLSAYITNINHGHVPFDLLNDDYTFWGKIMTDVMCDLYVECNSDALSENTHELDCSLVQCAHAYHESAYHYLSISVEPYSCYEQTGCMYTDYTTGTGTLDVSVSGTKHANTPALDYTVNLASSNQNVYLVATGTLEVGWSSDPIAPVTGIGSAYTSGTQRVEGVTCGSDHCGTYGLTVESNSYIIH